MALLLQVENPTQADGSGGDASEEEAAAILGSLTLDDLITFGIVFGVTLVLTFAVSRIVRRIVRRQNEMIATLLGRIVAGIVFAIGFVYSMNTVGVAVGPLIGALGVGGFAIAFAVQGILKNVLAGVLIQLRQPFNIGDTVKLEDYLGTVEEVTLRTVNIRTLSGEDVLIPAATVIENPIENWTSSGKRRVEVDVGIDYSVNPQAVCDGIRDALAGLDTVIDDPAPKVVVDEFGDSSVNLKILAWLEGDTSWWDCRNDVIVAAKEYCDSNGINLPFPTRNISVNPLEVRSAEDAEPTDSDDPDKDNGGADNGGADNDGSGQSERNRGKPVIDGRDGEDDGDGAEQEAADAGE